MLLPYSSLGFPNIQNLYFVIYTIFPPALVPQGFYVVFQAFLDARVAFHHPEPTNHIFRSEGCLQAAEKRRLPLPNSSLLVNCPNPSSHSTSSELESKMDIARALEWGQLTIADILKDEAAFLCESSPIPSELKRPNASRSKLTELAKMGKGVGHCVVRRWPVNNTPSAWGRRNEQLLLNQPINPGIWTKLGPEYDAIKRRIHTTRLSSMRADDNGNEEEYRHTIEVMMDRIFGAAFLFYLNEWLKPENSEDADYGIALQALKSFGVKAEYTHSDGSIRNDVGIVIPFSNMFRKKLYKPARLVCLSNFNAKNTGQSQWDYEPVTSHNFPEIKTVDGAMTVGLDIAETREHATIKSLKTILVQEYELRKHNLEWPIFALSHFAQMSYESSISTSSLGAFTSLWGFHRFCYREERPDDIPILYVSDNLSPDYTTPEDRTDQGSNYSILTQFYFMAVLAIEFSFTRATPPNLRQHDEFGSHIRRG